MPLPSQPETHHRALFRLESELPDGYEVRSETDEYSGVVLHHMVSADAYGWDPRIAADYPAARFSPGEVFLDASWAQPADFSPAPALAMKWAGKGGDDKTGPRPFLVEKDESGQMFVSGLIYVAGEKDTDGEFMRQPELAAFAHSLLDGGSLKGDTDHDRVEREGIKFTESCMVDVTKDDDGNDVIGAPSGNGVGWFGKARIDDPAVKARIELPADDPNSIKAFSWDGYVRKRVAAVTKSAASEPVRVVKAEQLDASKADDEQGVELYDGRCIRVSLVHRGANRRMFVAAAKSADADEVLQRAMKSEGQPKPGGLLAKIRQWAGKSEQGAPNPLAELGTLDAALSEVARWIRGEALAQKAPADEVQSVCKALGDAAAYHARLALTEPINDTRGSWFTPETKTPKETDMTPEQIKALVAETVSETLKAAQATEEPPPAPAPEAVTLEDVKKAAAEAAVQATEAAQKAWAEEKAKLTEELAEAKKRPAVNPTGGADDLHEERKADKPVSFIGRDLNHERRMKNNRAYAGYGKRGT